MQTTSCYDLKQCRRLSCKPVANAKYNIQPLNFDKFDFWIIHRGLPLRGQSHNICMYILCRHYMHDAPKQ